MGRKVSTLKQGGKRFTKPVGNAADPDGLLVMMTRYLEHLKIKGTTDCGLWNVERYVRDFIGWCDARSLERPQEISKPILETYQRYLFYYRKKDGQPLSVTSQRGKVIPLKGWFKWLTKHNYLLSNPASELELPRQRHRLPKHVLTEEEAERVLAQANTRDPLGVRDRAVMETLYSTGIRRSEIVNLSLFDVDHERGTLMVRQGKGSKDRHIPIGERALQWIQTYLSDVRPHLVVGQDDHTLFLTRVGEKFNACWLSITVAKYVERANLGKRGACHLFRHTMATVMLENGCDIRFIQAMLGHADLKSTQIYTQVAIKVLKQMHQATHPSALMHRVAHGNQEHAIASRSDDVLDLLAALDAEADEEHREVVRH